MTRAGLLLAPLALLMPAAALAQSDSRFSTDVALTAGYSNNPFSVDNNDTGSALVGVDILPRYSVQTARSTLTVSAAARLQKYLEHYSSNENYSGAVDYSVRPTERLTGHAQVNLSSSVLGAYDSYFPTTIGSGVIDPGAGTGTGTGTDPATGPGSGTVIVPVDPGFGLPPVSDLGLFGLRQRRKLGRVSGDLGYALSARDSLTFGGYAELSRYDRSRVGGIGIGDYNAYGLSAGYSRQISEGLSLGAQGSADRYDYDAAGADSRVYSIQGTVAARLSALWSLNGALGVSIVDSGGFGSTNATSLSGNVNLCRRGDRSTACIRAARQVRPTGLIGSQYTSLLGLSWSMQLSERENLSLDGSYSRVGGGNQMLPGSPWIATDYGRIGGGYSRTITERLRFVASASLRKLFGNDNGIPLDIGGQIGISYRYGDLR